MQNGELFRLALVGSILLHTVQAAKDTLLIVAPPLCSDCNSCTGSPVKQ